VNSTVRQIVFWVLIIGGAFLLYQVFSGRNNPKETTLSYSALLEKAQQKPTQVKKAVLEEGHGITGELISGESFKTELPNEFARLM
jgi:predicted negative regulator of RcsB-dependent stress response